MPTTYTQIERQALLNFLQRGRANAVGAFRLAQLLGYPTSGNQVQLRGLIKECIEIDGDLIGSSTYRPSGFFIISNVSELENYLDSLEKRTRSDNQRRTSLLNSWNGNPTNSPTTRQPLVIT